MNQILYRTVPRLVIFSFTFLGFVFFGLLSWLIWANITDNDGILIHVLFYFFILFSLVIFYFFLTIRIVKLTKEKISFSYIFLPIKKSFHLSEIKEISQKTKEVKAVVGGSWKESHIFTEVKTIFLLSDGNQIQMTSIGEMDYEKFVKIFYKTKRGEGKFKPYKLHLVEYLLDNFSDLFWILFLLILTIGLTFGLFAK